MAEAVSKPTGSIPAERRRVQYICDFYIPEIHAGVVAYAGAAGWSLLDTTVYIPLSLLKYEEPVDGIVASCTQPELCAWLRKQTCPVVRLICTDQETPFPAVEPDCAAIGRIGAEHLLSLGSPTFVFYRAAETPETRRLWESFAATVGAAGHTAHLLDFAASVSFKVTIQTPRRARWEWMREQLRNLPRPTAIMVEDDRFANDVIEAAAMLGWRIPEDLAVLGVDNRALILGKLHVPLSSVDTNLHGIGWAGAALVDRILDGTTPPKEPVLVKPGPVVARRSTATFVCANAAVSAAVNFLRLRYHEPIQVADIAKAVSLSPRTIQAAFREHVGCTISDELSRLRLAHASRLLRETDLKLESVAHESGLTSAKYLCDVFRAAFNFTPTEYRESQRVIARNAAS